MLEIPRLTVGTLIAIGCTAHPGRAAEGEAIEALGFGLRCESATGEHREQVYSDEPVWIIVSIVNQGRETAAFALDTALSRAATLAPADEETVKPRGATMRHRPDWFRKHRLKPQQSIECAVLVQDHWEFVRGGACSFEVSLGGIPALHAGAVRFEVLGRMPEDARRNLWSQLASRYASGTLEVKRRLVRSLGGLSSGDPLWRPFVDTVLSDPADGMKAILLLVVMESDLSVEDKRTLLDKIGTSSDATIRDAARRAASSL